MGVFGTLLVPALALLLGACASGGNTGSGTGSSGGTSSGSSGGLNTTPTPGVNYDTAEYRANWGLPAINAAAAYSDGATGQGITVGVIDTGLDITHPEFVNHYDPASTDIADPTQTVNDVDGHGTLVAGIIAAKKNDVGMHGVAFDANLLAVRADRTGTCASSGGCSFYDNDIAAGIDYAVAHGARIINLSLGGTDPATSTLQTAMSNAVQKGAVIVIAAGNIKSSDPAGTGSDPDPLAQYAHDPRANGQVIIAGAADHSLQAASFSYKAGTYKDVYLLAPGYAIYTTYNDGGYTSMYGGTSLATPHIVGAAALLMQAFPNLTAQQVVQLLLSTATDEGTVGPDATNGMGFLNIAAAFAPQGTLSVSMSPQTTSGTSTSSQTVALTASLMSLGPAFGDASEPRHRRLRCRRPRFLQPGLHGRSWLQGSPSEPRRAVVAPESHQRFFDRLGPSAAERLDLGRSADVQYRSGRARVAPDGAGSPAQRPRRGSRTGHEPLQARQDRALDVDGR